MLILCLNDNILQEELHYIKTCFTVIKGYPKSLLKQSFDCLTASNKNYNNHSKNKNSNNTNINHLSDKTVHTLKLQTLCLQINILPLKEANLLQIYCKFFNHTRTFLVTLPSFTFYFLYFLSYLFTFPINTCHIFVS